MIKWFLSVYFVVGHIQPAIVLATFGTARKQYENVEIHQQSKCMNKMTYAMTARRFILTFSKLHKFVQFYRFECVYHFQCNFNIKIYGRN